MSGGFELRARFCLRHRDHLEYGISIVMKEWYEQQSADDEEGKQRYLLLINAFLVLLTLEDNRSACLVRSKDWIDQSLGLKIGDNETNDRTAAQYVQQIHQQLQQRQTQKEKVERKELHACFDAFLLARHTADITIMTHARKALHACLSHIITEQLQQWFALAETLLEQERDEHAREALAMALDLLSRNKVILVPRVYQHYHITLCGWLCTAMLPLVAHVQDNNKAKINHEHNRLVLFRKHIELVSKLFNDSSRHIIKRVVKRKVYAESFARLSLFNYLELAAIGRADDITVHGQLSRLGACSRALSGTLHPELKATVLFAIGSLELDYNGRIDLAKKAFGEVQALIGKYTSVSVVLQILRPAFDHVEAILQRTIPNSEPSHVVGPVSTALALESASDTDEEEEEDSTSKATVNHAFLGPHVFEQICGVFEDLELMCREIGIARLPMELLWIRMQARKLFFDLQGFLDDFAVFAGRETEIEGKLGKLREACQQSLFGFEPITRSVFVPSIVRHVVQSMAITYTKHSIDASMMEEMDSRAVALHCMVVLMVDSHHHAKMKLISRESEADLLSLLGHLYRESNHLEDAQHCFEYAASVTLQRDSAAVCLSAELGSALLHGHRAQHSLAMQHMGKCFKAHGMDGKSSLALQQGEDSKEASEQEEEGCFWIFDAGAMDAAITNGSNACDTVRWLQAIRCALIAKSEMEFGRLLNCIENVSLSLKWDSCCTIAHSVLLFLFVQMGNVSMMESQVTRMQFLFCTGRRAYLSARDWLRAGILTLPLRCGNNTQAFSQMEHERGLQTGMDGVWFERAMLGNSLTAMLESLRNISNARYHPRANLVMMVLVKGAYAKASSGKLHAVAVDGHGDAVNWLQLLGDELFSDASDRANASKSSLGTKHKKRKKMDGKQGDGTNQLLLWKLVLRRAEWWLHVADHAMLSVSDVQAIQEYELLPPTSHNSSGAQPVLLSRAHSKSAQHATELLILRSNAIAAIASVRMDHFTRALEFTSHHTYGVAAVLQASDSQAEALCSQLLDVHLYSLASHPSYNVLEECHRLLSLCHPTLYNRKHVLMMLWYRHVAHVREGNVARGLLDLQHIYSVRKAGIGLAAYKRSEPMPALHNMLRLSGGHAASAGMQSQLDGHSDFSAGILNVSDMTTTLVSLLHTGEESEATAVHVLGILLLAGCLVEAHSLGEAFMKQGDVPTQEEAVAQTPEQDHGSSSSSDTESDDDRAFIMRRRSTLSGHRKSLSSSMVRAAEVTKLPPEEANRKDSAHSKTKHLLIAVLLFELHEYQAAKTHLLDATNDDLSQERMKQEEPHNQEHEGGEGEEHRFSNKQNHLKHVADRAELEVLFALCDLHLGNLHSASSVLRGTNHRSLHPRNQSRMHAGLIRVLVGNVLQLAFARDFKHDATSDALASGWYKGMEIDSVVTGEENADTKECVKIRSRTVLQHVLNCSMTLTESCAGFQQKDAMTPLSKTELLEVCVHAMAGVAVSACTEAMAPAVPRTDGQVLAMDQIQELCLLVYSMLLLCVNRKSETVFRVLSQLVRAILSLPGVPWLRHAAVYQELLFVQGLVRYLSEDYVGAVVCLSSAARQEVLESAGRAHPQLFEVLSLALWKTHDYTRALACFEKHFEVVVGRARQTQCNYSDWTKGEEKKAVTQHIEVCEYHRCCVHQAYMECVVGKFDVARELLHQTLMHHSHPRARVLLLFCLFHLSQQSDRTTQTLRRQGYTQCRALLQDAKQLSARDKCFVFQIYAHMLSHGYNKDAGEYLTTEERLSQALWHLEQAVLILQSASGSTTAHSGKSISTMQEAEVRLEAAHMSILYSTGVLQFHMHNYLAAQHIFERVVTDGLSWMHASADTSLDTEQEEDEEMEEGGTPREFFREKGMRKAQVLVNMASNNAAVCVQQRQRHWTYAQLHIPTQASVAVFEQLESKSLVAAVNVGIAHIHQHSYAEALAQFKRLVPLLKQARERTESARMAAPSKGWEVLSWEDLEARCVFYTGVCCQLLSDYGKAVEHYENVIHRTQEHATKVLASEEATNKLSVSSRMSKAEISLFLVACWNKIHCLFYQSRDFDIIIKDVERLIQDIRMHTVKHSRHDDNELLEGFHLMYILCVPMFERHIAPHASFGANDSLQRGEGEGESQTEDSKHRHDSFYYSVTHHRSTALEYLHAMSEVVQQFHYLAALLVKRLTEAASVGLGELHWRDYSALERNLKYHVASTASTTVAALQTPVTMSAYFDVLVGSKQRRIHVDSHWFHPFLVFGDDTAMDKTQALLDCLGGNQAGKVLQQAATHMNNALVAQFQRDAAADVHESTESVLTSVQAAFACVRGAYHYSTGTPTGLELKDSALGQERHSSARAVMSLAVLEAETLLLVWRWYLRVERGELAIATAELNMLVLQPTHVLLSKEGDTTNRMYSPILSSAMETWITVVNVQQQQCAVLRCLGSLGQLEFASEKHKRRNTLNAATDLYWRAISLSAHPKWSDVLNLVQLYASHNQFTRALGVLEQFVLDPCASNERGDLLPTPIRDVMCAFLTAWRLCFVKAKLLRLDGAEQEVGREVEQEVSNINALAGLKDALPHLESQLACVLHEHHVAQGKQI